MRGDPLARVDRRDVTSARRRAVVALALAAGVATLAACATPYGQGQAALRQGRWDEAARRFEEALVRDPGRPPALTGLGVARYKSGALEPAAEALERAVAGAPDDAEALLYLGLARLRLRRDDAAAESLRALLALRLHPRLAAHVERTLPLLAPELPDAVRRFIAASLDDAAAWASDLHEAERVPRPPFTPGWVIWWDHQRWYPPRWCP